jgi:ribonuclease P protein component
MIKKKFKLSGEEIKKFFEQKYFKIGNENFLIYYQKNNLNYPRFSVLPKKEIFKKAVERNKVKRQVYIIIRELLKEGKIKNYDFFIILSREQNFDQLKNSLTKILTNV